MKDEYIIINKTAIQKRIDELEEEYKSESAYQFNTYGDKLIKEILILKQILSKSTSLIPEIEKAIQYGIKIESSNIRVDYEKYSSAENQYIANLKLDI